MKKLMLRSSLVLAAVSFMTLTATSVNAESALDPAPEVQATPSKVNGKKVLFDNTHGQTAGAADWVIDGAFSDFADALGKDGYYVKELRQLTPITLADLQGYDVFVIPEANIPYKVSEQQAIADYVSQGGSVLYVGDHYNADRNKNRIDSSEAFNGYRRGAFTDMTKGMSEAEKNSEAMQGVESSDWLNETFGVRFRYNSLDKINDSHKWIVEDAFGIAEGVTDVGLHAGSTVAITDPKRAKGIIYTPNGLTKGNKWGHAVDEGVYNGGGIDEGAYVAISKRDSGKAAFIGDSSLVEDASPKYMREENGSAKKTYDGFSEADDAKLLMQLVDWLDDTETYTTFEEKGIKLSKPTPVLDFEVPANSTEPQNEPWSAPSANYKWYDTSTFASGSFGSGVAPTVKPSVSVEYVGKPSINAENKAILTFSGLAPNSQADGYQFGVYTPITQHGFKQGNQVAKTKVGDNPWQDTIGYSSKFGVTANEEGIATLEVAFKVEFEGEYNFRIRYNKDNFLTKAITIGAESSTETPEEKPGEPTDAKSDNYDVKGQISFTTEDGPVSPVDPENPNTDGRPINPDGSEPNSGAGGLLSIDYASSFAFDKQKIDNKLKTYGALGQRFKDSDELRGNYVQVTDRRGTNAGWVLSIVQNEQFTSKDKAELTGAKLFLGNGYLNSPNMLQEGFSEKTMPAHLVSALTVKDEMVQGGLELIPGQSTVIMTANKGQGMGTWTLAYGQSKDGNIGLAKGNDPMKSSVLLSIPSSANPKETSYESTLTYKLSMVPAP
ncbi:hypothetical protein CBF34_09000 [Vagococcus penaei]|uniref:Uncharacterized protein n=1 Tax=Vagococcus penaei TaxID=633807 RepID=A0A1Q2D4R8_9ENTE|nr:WxL domain-containing protein [Vagococcus penaei]AQP53390.1 hypothetical protein BW732_03490 [Vagococcus penaei]RST99712.1 hypothetical protein CBF34_09000 [Vagococcus penaei]